MVRHVRILQLAIQETESSVGPGHLTPLPDLTVNRRIQLHHPSFSPIDDDDMEAGLSPYGEKGINDPAHITHEGEERKKGFVKKRGKAGRPKQDGPLEQETSLTITLPAQGAGNDPAEELYCYCNEGSFGEVPLSCNILKSVVINVSSDDRV